MINFLIYEVEKIIYVNLLIWSCNSLEALKIAIPNFLFSSKEHKGNLTSMLLKKAYWAWRYQAIFQLQKWEHFYLYWQFYR